MMAPSAGFVSAREHAALASQDSSGLSKDDAAALLNPDPARRIDDLIAIRRDVTTRGGKTFVSIFFRSS